MTDMAITQPKARILTLEDVGHLRYPLPESWKKTAGLLKERKGLLDPVFAKSHLCATLNRKLRRA